MDMKRFNFKELNEGEVREQYQVTIRNNFTALEILKNHGGVNGAWGSIRENVKILAQEGLK
jgi:hypothetical protein